MADAMPEPGRLRSTERIAAHARRLPTWHKRILFVGTLLTTCGLGWQAVNHFRQPPADPAQVRRPTDGAGAATPGNSRTIVGANDTPVPSPDSADATAEAEPRGRVPVWMTRVGGSFLLGFLIGFAFRTFLKVTTFVAVVAALGFAALSYFRVVNVDSTAARERYDSAAAWVKDQGDKLKDAALNYVPHSTAGFVGMFIGFRRR